MSCVYSPLQGSYAHNTINCRPFSATRHCICLQHAQSLWHLKTSEDSEPCTGPAYKPCHIDLRSLAPPQAYPRSPAATTSNYRSAARRNKCKGTPAEKDSHVMCLQPVARELRPQHNQLQTFFCNTSQGRLQECQGYGQPRPDQTLSQRCQFSGSLNATCVGPESRFPTQKLAETHTQTLEILENQAEYGS